VVLASYSSGASWRRLAVTETRSSGAKRTTPKAEVAPRSEVAPVLIEASVSSRSIPSRKANGSLATPRPAVQRAVVRRAS
jgi:hypothetical protein